MGSFVTNAVTQKFKEQKPTTASAKTARPNLIEEGPIDALHDGSLSQVYGTDDEEVLLLLVADKIGHGERGQRPRQPEGLAEALLRRGIVKADGAVGERLGHTRPHR